MILDTSFLIDLMDGDEGAVSMATRSSRRSRHSGSRHRLSTNCSSASGTPRRPRRNARRLRSAVESRPVVDTTPGIAKLAGRTNGKFRRKGRAVSTGDVIIGATARHYDEPVVTGNPGDFEVIPGVTVERYD